LGSLNVSIENELNDRYRGLPLSSAVRLALAVGSLIFLRGCASGWHRGEEALRLSLLKRSGRSGEASLTALQSGKPPTRLNLTQTAYQWTGSAG
jgi:hypothetical protein